MRCADLGPTPGKQRKASISESSPDGFTDSERQLESGRQVQAGRKASHLFLADIFAATNRIIHGGSHEILQHLTVIHHRRLDADTTHFMCAGHDNLDHSSTSLALYFDLSQLI